MIRQRTRGCADLSGGIPLRGMWAARMMTPIGPAARPDLVRSNAHSRRHLGSPIMFRLRQLVVASFALAVLVATSRGDDRPAASTPAR